MNFHLTWQETFRWVVVFLAGVLIICLPGFTKIGKYAFYLLSLFSLFYVAFNYRNLPKLSRHEKIFFGLIVIGFLWTVVTYYVNGAPQKGHNLVWSRQFYLLMIIPLYYFFRSMSIPGRNIVLILALSSVITTAVAINDVYFHVTEYGERAHGGMNPILFGSISLCLAGCILSIIICNKKEPIIHLVGWVAILLLFVAVFLSASRGVWLGIPLLVLMGVGFGLPKVHVKLKVGLLVISLLSVSFFYFIPGVKERVDKTVVNINKYMSSESANDDARYSSFGTRMEMWRAGLKMFIESPLLGVGMGGYQEKARKNLQKYNVHESVTIFYHPHNQYVSALSTRGLLGLIFVLILLFYPIFLLWISLRSNQKNAMYVFSGIFLCLSYAVYSITDVPLEGKATIIFFATILAFVLSAVKPKGSS